MDRLRQIDWSSVDWVTPAIHIYAFIVLLLTVTVYVLHRYRLNDLARRVGIIARHIEGEMGRGPQAVDLDNLTGVILHLGDVVRRKADIDLLPVLAFLRSEERHRQKGVVSTLVNVTETMIELFPVLGILGTVWGISGVSKEDFSSDRLLFLFGVAVSTTLWALLYVLIFRIAYSAFVQDKVQTLADHVDRYREFLTILEERGMQGSKESAAPARKAGLVP